jgi:hypothetical protein
MTTYTTAAGPGIRKIHDDLVCRGGRLVEQELSEFCVHLRGHLSGVHGGERLGALVLRECCVSAIGGVQQLSAL